MIRSLIHLVHVSLILTILAPVQLWAAVGTSAAENWYLIQGCTHNGDGLAQACAPSAGASGAWNDPANVSWTVTTGVDDGDSLWIGGTFVCKTLTVGSSANAPSNNRIKIRFDLAGNPGKIRNVCALTEALTAGNWTDMGGNVWRIDVNAYVWDDPNRMWLNGVEILGTDTLSHLGTQVNGGGPVTRWYHDGAAGHIYLYNVGNPATGLTSLEGLFASGSNDYAPIRINGAGISGIEIINPNVEGGNLAALYTLGPNDIVIHGSNGDRSTCNIGKHSGRGILLQGTSTSGMGSNNTDIVIYDCTIDAGWPSHLADYRYELTHQLGNGVEVSGSTRPIITRTTIKDWSHANLYIVSIGGTDTVVDGKFNENLLTFSNAVAYARPLNVDGDALGRASNNEFNRNELSNFTVRPQLNGNGNKYVGNKIGPVRETLVLKSGTTQHGQSLSIEKYAVISQDNLYANNTVFGNGVAPCVDYRNTGSSSTGHKWYNNAFINCGNAAYTALPNGEGVAFYLPSSFTGNLDIRNNHFHPVTSNPFSLNGTKYTIAGFEAACPAGSTCSGNFTGDPLFLSYSSNLRPSTGSPLRAAGIAYTGCIDILGRACKSPNPDVGMYQLNSPDGASSRWP